ncbi:MAG: hypothetical protein HQL94_09895, partial [Magnetococcales bacterium]|nr:hypothetical protein [Magnetococcales bacterium]
MISLIDEACIAGSRFEVACEILKISPRTVQKWREDGNVRIDGRLASAQRRTPANRLSANDRQTILEVANCPEFASKSPSQIVPTFAIVTLAHLRAKQTKNQPQTRYEERWRITRSLYQRGFNRKQIANLYTFIEWVMSLPTEMEGRFLEELITFEEEKKMQYVLYAERK